MGVADLGAIVAKHSTKMPAKKKGGAGKKKKNKKKEAKTASEKENAVAKVRRFLKVYPAKCEGSFPSSRIMRACRDALGHEKPLTTVS